MLDKLALTEGPIKLEAEIKPPRMSELVRDFNWAATPLGPVTEWPDSLRAAVQIVLTSGFPMWMAWGPELTLLYNDGYARTTLGKKHPRALGRPVNEVWSEIWKDIAPRIHRVLETGEASWDETLPLILERSGYPEESYHTFSYSPLVGPDGENAGMLCVVIEDTGRVIGERQLAALGTLAATLVDANTEKEVFAAINSGLTNQKDLPFALTYLFDENRGKLKLVAHSGVEAGHPAACLDMTVGSHDCPWPMEQILSTNRAVTVENLAEYFPERPALVWNIPPTKARLVPIARKGQETPAGVFIAALNPYRQLDANYAGFLDLIAGQIAASIANAKELVARVEAQLKMARLRKEAGEQEAALTQEIQRARQFAWETLEHIPDSFCTFDRDFRIMYMNPAAAKLASASGMQHLGKCLWDLYPTLKATPVETNFRRAMEERIPIEFEQYFQTDSLEKWYQFQVFPQPGEGLILYLRDTTDARRTEQALRRSEQLAAAGRLAASIAHEINNPLEALTNLLFLVKMDESVTGSTKRLLEVADKELQRLSHITARSLKFYRQRTAPSLTSLEELIESVLFFHEAEIKTRGIDLDRRYRNAPQILCLAGEIQQVLTNLMSNALEALEERGRMVVAVRPGQDREGRQGATVTIADSGCGMDRFTMERLFHPFVTTKGEAGTGLGLWVSRGILDKHHSKIAVRSKRGHGTVFRFLLPLDTTVGADTNQLPVSIQ